MAPDAITWALSVEREAEWIGRIRTMRWPLTPRAGEPDIAPIVVDVARLVRREPSLPERADLC